jgi:hypothetical protein
VFSIESLRTIDKARRTRLTYEALDVHTLSFGPDGHPHLHGSYDGKMRTIVSDYLVVATGFDPLWFVSLLVDAELRARFGDRRTVEKQIQADLAMAGVAPLIHLPMLAGLAQGAGFPNLSCLGHVADRIISAYM